MVNKKKILFLITKSNWGGAQKYVFELANELNKKGDYEIVVASGGKGLLLDKLKEYNIKHLPLDSLINDFNIFSVFENIEEILNLIKNEKPDIIHLNSSKISILGIIASKIYGKNKTVFTCHGWPFNEDRTFPVKIILKMMMAFIVLMSDKIIVGSNAVLKQTPFLNFIKSKISKIYIGLTHYELLERNKAREILNIKEDGKTHIVTNAELNKNKGYDYALGAIHQIVHEDCLPVHYHIISTGKYKEQIENKIKELNLENFVTLHGFVNDARKYMSAFDVFLLTSITEAFGLVLTEALYGRLPVVATNVGGISEIIIDGETGLLAKSKSVKDIHDKLKTILTDKNLTNKFKENGFKKVKNEFSFDETVKETEKVYEKLDVRR